MIALAELVGGAAVGYLVGCVVGLTARRTVDQLVTDAIGGTEFEVRDGIIRCDQPLTPAQIDAFRRAWDAARRADIPTVVECHLPDDAADRLARIVADERRQFRGWA